MKHAILHCAVFLVLPSCTPVLEPDALFIGSGTPLEPFGRQAYCLEAERRDDPRDRPFRTFFCHGAAPPTVAALTPDRLRELEGIQHRVNATVSYRATTTWDPLVGWGDCKTYAARKALELLERGWPAGALRLATAFVNDGGPFQHKYHAVLLVDTERGTLVLDNRYRSVQRWSDVAYIWAAAQAPGQQAWWRLPSTIGSSPIGADQR